MDEKKNAQNNDKNGNCERKNHLPRVPFYNIYFKWVSNDRNNNANYIENDYKVQMRCIFYLTQRKLVQEN